MKQAKLEESGRYFVRDGQATRLAFIRDPFRRELCDGSEKDVSRGLLSISEKDVTKELASSVV